MVISPNYPTKFCLYSHKAVLKWTDIIKEKQEKSKKADYIKAFILKKHLISAAFRLQNWSLMSYNTQTLPAVLPHNNVDR